jgi:hypothetical protein
LDANVVVHVSSSLLRSRVNRSSQFQARCRSSRQSTLP